MSTTKKRSAAAGAAAPSISLTHPLDEHGLPVGIATLTEAQVCERFNVTRRQLRRWRTGEHPTLPCFRPSGPQSPPLYRRSDLIAWLSR
ncbi:helix-turn-helix domain-containing protein [Nocardioides sp. J9]|uniref:helix-turn-helix domain-containing protein n=1 Tax=Nocardioides sp. J9 TaxID=935844 RepID=UPI00119EAAE2|nr:helix-turn-helix domain-containing protein [Nocardioides sp. J9]